MIGTTNCIYETPCGWCSKWDKKCDNKMPERSFKVETNPNDIKTEYVTNKICKSESDHERVCCGVSTEGSSYICKKCFAYKNIPNTTL